MRQVPFLDFMVSDVLKIPRRINIGMF